jgi:hypothetical protein
MRRLSLLPMLLVLVSCGTDDLAAPALPDVPSLESSRAAKAPRFVATKEIEIALRSLAAELQATYGERRASPVRADWMAGPGGLVKGNTVLFADVGNKQLGIEWVPGDPRRQGRHNVTYGVVPTAPDGLTPDQVMAAADRAMATWATQTCSMGLDIVKTSFADPTVDILHAGWDDLPPPVLGVTIPFAFIDETGAFTDIDRDGAVDYAFAAIVYSSNYAWAIDGNIDVESIFLHEAGHGLGQAHFGSLFQTLSNGFYHFAPLAVMNAGYTGPLQRLLGTDKAGHCALFASWPSR